MSAMLPHAVRFAQPHSVAFHVYRIWMGDSLKKQITARVMALIRQRKDDPTLDRAKCETALRGMGMKAGNAQRLLDDSTDVQLSRIEEVADLLGVAPAALLEAGAPPPAFGLATALPLVLDALIAIPAARRASVRAQLDQVAQHPEMRDDVLAELLALLQTPPGKHRVGA